MNLEYLEALAAEFSDGQFTVFKFTGNWGVCLGTFSGDLHLDRDGVGFGPTLAAAIEDMKRARRKTKNPLIRRAEIDGNHD